MDECMRDNYLNINFFNTTRQLLSRFRYINYSIDDLLLGVDVTVLTRTLTLDELSEKYTSRLDLILKLSNQGLSNKEISDNLNTNGIRPPRTKEYTSKLIWVTLKKIRQREERTKNTKTFFGKPSFYKKESNNPFL